MASEARSQHREDRETDHRTMWNRVRIQTSHTQRTATLPTMPGGVGCIPTSAIPLTEGEAVKPGDLHHMLLLADRKDDPTLPAHQRRQILAELANYYNRLVNEHPDIEAEIDAWCSDLNDHRSMWEVLRDICVARGLL